jgi:hypothetical protein
VNRACVAPATTDYDTKDERCLRPSRQGFISLVWEPLIYTVKICSRT